MQLRRRLWTNPGNFSQVEHGFRCFGSQAVPRIECTSFEQVDNFCRDRLSHTGNFLQARQTFLVCDLFQRRGPDLDRFGCVTIRAPAKRTGSATNEQNKSEAPAPGETQPAEVTANEDLMREHGILRRALLVYQESVVRLRQDPASVPPDALEKTANLFRVFGEEYHEKK